MLTIFAIPKPFNGYIDIIQRNAIQSWLALDPTSQVILFGDDEGVAQVAEEYGILHVPEVKKNEFGTPLLNSAFELAQKISVHRILAYINCDIVLFPDFITAIKRIEKENFLMTGRRFDLDFKDEINFMNTDWQDSLRRHIADSGKLHGYSGLDYFVFTRNLPHNLPGFTVGRQGWDNWLLWSIRTQRIPIIDATESITAVHQNHDYSHSSFGEKKRVGGPEVDNNIKLAGGFSNLLTLRDADWILNKRGLSRPKYSRRIFAALSLWYPWQTLLSVKRNLQKYFII